MLSMSNAETLINAFMNSRLDYCNALLVFPLAGILTLIINCLSSLTAVTVCLTHLQYMIV